MQSLRVIIVLPGIEGG